MNKTVKRILVILALIVVLAIAAFFGIYRTRIQTINSIAQLTDYSDGYNLYRMDVKYDYSLEDVLSQNITDDQSFINAVIKESFPLLPVKIEVLHSAARHSR